jgi:hypothetical protein
MTAPTGKPIGVANPALVARKENALTATLRDHPGLTVPQLADQVGERRTATADRLRRLLLRGEVERDGRLWRLAQQGPEDDEPPIVEYVVEPKPEPDDPSRWVRPISRYLRAPTDEAFFVARYG